MAWSRRRTSSRWIVASAVPDLCAPVQRRFPRLGLTATSMPLPSSAGCRSRCSTITAGVLSRRTCRMAPVSGPICSVGFCRMTSSMTDTAARAMLKPLSQSLTQNLIFCVVCLAVRRVRRWTDAQNSHADAMVVAQSFARRRLRVSHAGVRSTTDRRGRRAKPFAPSDRLTISIVPSPVAADAPHSLSPAEPPSAKMWRSLGQRWLMAFNTSGAASRS